MNNKESELGIGVRLIGFVSKPHITLCNFCNSLNEIKSLCVYTFSNYISPDVKYTCTCVYIYIYTLATNHYSDHIKCF